MACIVKKIVAVQWVYAFTELQEMDKISRSEEEREEYLERKG